MLTTIVVGVLALAAGVGLGYLIRRNLASGKLAGAEREAEKTVKDARREAETILKEAKLEAKEEVHRVRGEVEAELRDRRAELTGAEQRMVQREEQLEARALEQDRRDQSLRDREANTQQLAEQLEGERRQVVETLERVAGMSTAQARETLLQRTEDDARHDMAKLVRQVEEEARREADRRARNVLALSIQRTAADHVAETTVSVVQPADRRHEGPHHRPRGAQHPRLRERRPASTSSSTTRRRRSSSRASTRCAARSPG